MVVVPYTSVGLRLASLCVALWSCVVHFVLRFVLADSMYHITLNTKSRALHCKVSDHPGGVPSAGTALSHDAAMSPTCHATRRWSVRRSRGRDSGDAA